MEPTNQGEAPKLSQVIQIDEGKIQEHLGEVVRSTVEETLNAMLDAEADRLCQAERYERTEARKDTRAGCYQRHLQTKANEVTLKVPKLRTLPFETEIIERYRRRESSVEEGLVEMYLTGVSVRRVEDITEALWGTRVSPSTVSELNQKIYGQIEACNPPIEGQHPYVFLDGLNGGGRRVLLSTDGRLAECLKVLVRCPGYAKLTRTFLDPFSSSRLTRRSLSISVAKLAPV